MLEPAAKPARSPPPAPPPPPEWECSIPLLLLSPGSALPFEFLLILISQLAIFGPTKKSTWSRLRQAVVKCECLKIGVLVKLTVFVSRLQEPGFEPICFGCTRFFS